ncbi:hypothetical protein BpHYR1_012893, partial [Brachionus plicatilis]
ILGESLEWNGNFSRLRQDPGKFYELNFFGEIKAFMNFRQVKMLGNGMRLALARSFLSAYLEDDSAFFEQRNKPYSSIGVKIKTSKNGGKPSGQNILKHHFPIFYIVNKILVRICSIIRQVINANFTIAKKTH